ncbi:hypothetical protein P3X46_014465 [Hevea brasiliensis]|uniref:R13L1/DRL21-like LRR repeat region domain-containing protein n=1 Tax=Hevea brasiliensis TaxID=3981 RepID=A0ABQ9M6R1_HEVBR|nr:hypothetical protein P3X46_014465 [Hevea brasiliensis]
MVGRLTCLETLPLFVVGPDRGGSIQELECLNQLRGSLRIKHLEVVRDKEEAMKSNLRGKTKIKALKFIWSDGRELNSNDEEVLAGLEPHPNIETIVITNYLGRKFPSWLLMKKIPSGGDSFVALDNLKELILWDCKWCEELPKLGHLPCLKVLWINGMDNIKSIGNEFYGIDDGSTSNGVRPFPALMTLYFISMKSLVEWKTAPVDEGGETVVFSCLENLMISKCPRLTKIPLSDRSSLVSLNIDDCEELSYLFDELHSFSSLKSLFIGRCNKLTSFPSGLKSFTSLERLEILRCEGLTSVPEYLGKSHSLTRLSIVHCQSLSYFPEKILGGLTRLRDLIIGGFSEELDSFSYLKSIQDLPSLKFLVIHGDVGGRIKSLPDQLQCFTALTRLDTLNICDFNGMEALPEWLGKLSSLKSLGFWDCKNLKYLPSATAMQRFSKLTELRILGCPFLRENCAKGIGFEWSKISHIPYIDIRKFTITWPLLPLLKMILFVYLLFCEWCRRKR